MRNNTHQITVVECADCIHVHLAAANGKIKYWYIKGANLASVQSHMDSLTDQQCIDFLKEKTK